MKEYAELFERDKAYASKAARFVEGVRDINELLVEIGFAAPTGRVEERVTFQDSCHLVHAQRIKDAPRDILRSIPGLELAEMATPDRCCGSAGIYNVTQTDMSRRVLDDKMLDVMSTDCDVVCTANPGCMLQLDLGVRLNGGSQEVLHVVELLDRAYRAEEASATTRRTPSP
jgi:Fe-S oxidoreductase